MTQSVYDAYTVYGVRVTALSRHGGASESPYESLNLAEYVGDDHNAVARNIEVVTQLAGREVAVMSAEHGTRIVNVDAPGACPSGDIAVSHDSSIALLALAADCLPIAFMNEHIISTAVVHAGWRGLAAGVLDVALQEFESTGWSLESTAAVIGPSICGTCYEVGPEVIGAIEAIYPNAVLDSSHVDLALAATAFLSQQGIAVHAMTGCTFEDESLFSFRRARGSATGRGGLLVSRVDAISVGGNPSIPSDIQHD